MSAGGPFFVEPHTTESEGVDYLGLRALNLSMMDNLLPGLNNVVSMVRPFSVMAWVAWKFEQGVAGRATVSSQDFEVFKQKVETLFVYTHVQASNAAGLPGNRQTTPPGDPISFQFSAFRRMGSILDAALYGPSMKNLNGLGFLSSGELGFFKPTRGAGEQMAAALDQQLRAHLSASQYEFVSSLEQTEAWRSLIDERFQDAWSVSNVSTAEQQIFRERLFQPASIGERGIHARRSAVLRYALACLGEQKQPVEVAQLRRAMACRFPQSLLQNEHSKLFHLVQRHWQLLQVRQAQRLALEAVFGWVERCLFHGLAAGIDDMVDLALPALGLQAGSPSDESYLRSHMDMLRAVASDVDGLFAAGVQTEEWDVLLASEVLERALRNRLPVHDVVAQALGLLLLAAAHADAFKADPLMTKRVSEGAPFRMPLGMLANFVHAQQERPVSEVLHKLIGSFVISQHLGVAAARSGDEKSRMRLSIEDRGLTSLLANGAKVLSPRRTPDRLGSALALMADCGMVRGHPPGAGSTEPLYSAI
jgi:hypothetical protein